MINIELFNQYAYKLISIREDHEKLVSDLVLKTKELEKLDWKLFSRKLNEVNQSFVNYINGFGIKYILEFKKNPSDELDKCKIDFNDYCNKIFDEIYDEFEKKDAIL